MLCCLPRTTCNRNPSQQRAHRSIAEQRILLDTRIKAGPRLDPAPPCGGQATDMGRSAVDLRSGALEYGAEMNMTTKQLEAMGYVEINGEWIKRDRRMGALVSCIREQPTRSLECPPSKKPSRKESLGRKQTKRSRRVARGIRVTLIACRQKRLDDDNLAGGFKSLRDAIAESLGIDDGDERIEWVYRQQVSEKPHGTIVLITTTK